MSRNLWALLMYLAVFLFWNDYRDQENRIYTIAGFKLAALAIFIILVFKFRSGEPANNGSLITGWWGILGLIGWGYLVSAFTWVACRDSIFKTAVVILFFLGMNILSELDLLHFLNPVRPYLGVIIGGNVPLIVLTGLLGGLILKKFPPAGPVKLLPILISLGFFCLLAGFVLREWFIISKIKATPSWGMLCTGISFLVFTLLYWLADVKGWKSWFAFLKPAGENRLPHLARYSLLPDLDDRLPILIYKQSADPLSRRGRWSGITDGGLMALLAKNQYQVKNIV
jgi:hypothetical protein